MSTKLNALLENKLAFLRKSLQSLQDQYLAVSSQPANVSISGSVSYQNQDLKRLREEMAEIENQIVAIETGNSGVIRVLPRYWRTQGAYPR